MRDTKNLPLYDDLPLNEKLNMRHSWGVFGEKDQLGTLNFLTKESRLDAKKEVQKGNYYNLSIPLNLPDPPFFRDGYKHHIYSLDRNNQDDYLDNFYLQASSQWDALRHVSAREFGFYNGVTSEEAGSGGDKLGIENYVEKGIVGRALLVDVPRYMEKHGREFNPREQVPITVNLLESIIKYQGTVSKPGDILLLRTGFIGTYLKANKKERIEFKENLECAGLSAKEEMAKYLWDLKLSAICADNPAVERIPGKKEDGSLHRRLIPMLGFALGELFNFEELAEDCNKDGRYSCFFAGVPLNIPGGVGSPANAFAMK